VARGGGGVLVSRGIAAALWRLLGEGGEGLGAHDRSHASRSALGFGRGLHQRAAGGGAVRALPAAEHVCAVCLVPDSRRQRAAVFVWWRGVVDACGRRCGAREDERSRRFAPLRDPEERKDGKKEGKANGKCEGRSERRCSREHEALRTTAT